LLQNDLAVRPRCPFPLDRVDQARIVNDQDAKRI
jgi:hypothetical protein